ncbi:hypothetical protein SK128_005062 [Halocaridina rubra]|uniref:Uncharacterized protein n=1 Tax=Halocaridina rubra TaxID=373956 RepID=A0AAN8WUP8_HALRR
MFYRKKSLPKEQDRSKNSNPRVHPGADSRFIRAGSSVASHESSQFGSVMDWQQDNRAFDDPFRSHPGSRGGRFPENEHQGNWGSSSWTPEEWSRGIPAAYRGSDRDSRMDCPRYDDGYKGLTNLYPQMSRFGIDGEHFDGSRRGSGADVDFGARYDYSRDKGQSSLFMDSGRGTDYQSNYQAYGRSRFLGSEREESHTSFDLQRGHEPHYEGRRFYNPSKGEYPSMGSESGYGPFDGSNPYLAAREASTSFGSSQRGDSTHYGDSQTGESSFHMHSHDRERGRNPFERQFDVNKWDSYSRSDFRESADSPRGESSFHLRSHDLERSRNPFERQYEDNTRDSYSRSEFRESGDAPHREQWRNVTRSFSDRQTGRDSTLMDELKSKLSADPVTRELVRKDRDLALNIIEKVMVSRVCIFPSTQVYMDTTL